MREILFRGKTDDVRWVEGDLMHDFDNIPSSIRDCCGSNPVIPSSVSGFTGLCDKNGKRIFEGDIVKDIYRKDIDIVTYSGGGFAPFAIPGWECTPDADGVEIIGNIHDNPELKGGEG